MARAAPGCRQRPQDAGALASSTVLLPAGAASQARARSTRPSIADVTQNGRSWGDPEARSTWPVARRTRARVARRSASVPADARLRHLRRSASCVTGVTRGHFSPDLYVHNYGMPNQLFFWLALPRVRGLRSRFRASSPPRPPPSWRCLSSPLGSPARSGGQGWVGVLATPVRARLAFVWGVVANMITGFCSPRSPRLLIACAELIRRREDPACCYLDLAHEQMAAIGWMFVVLVCSRGPHALGSRSGRSRSRSASRSRQQG